MTLHIFHVYIRVRLCTEIIEPWIRLFLRLVKEGTFFETSISSS